MPMENGYQYKIAVIIPTFNRQSTLKDCIDALLAQDLEISAYEIIVVDDGSTDGTSEMVRAFSHYPNFRYIRQDNAGPATARNAGAKLAEGKLLLFLDDDVIASKSLLRSHVDAHNKDNNTAVLGYTPFDPKCIRNRNTAYYKLKWDNMFEMFSASIEPLHYNYFMSLNISLRKSVFDVTGGFDQRFRRADFEDTEYGYRLMLVGVPLVFCKQALALHRYETTFKKSCSRKFKSGYMAGTLFKTFPYLRNDFLVDYSLNQINKNDPLRIKAKKFTKKILFHSIILNALQKIIDIFSLIIPTRTLQYCFGVTESNWYAIGFRKGYFNSAREK